MMVPARDVERIYTEIVLGLSKAESTVTMSNEADALWDEIETEVRQMRAEGKRFDIPAEIPDVPRVHMIPEVDAMASLRGRLRVLERILQLWLDK
jgi:hypothetical protein